MKIYFAGSIRGGRGDAPLYKEIIDYLKTYGTVLSEQVGDLSLSEKGGDSDNDRYIHDRDMKWLTSADVLVAEVTTPSLGVGYEIGNAVQQSKQVLCLYRKGEGKSLSAMISGCPDITNVEYTTLEEAKKAIDVFLKDI
ncbi:MAG: nucleoside 2-deoxyribosyltransferase [Spirochaetota bacterium]|nr:MAG: nucleoside 2-deoxyribosyltransferase [Spirochaetota bacterium]